MSAASGDERALARTPLYALHISMGARMGPFAGFDMPIHYPPGVLKEHLHTRGAAGVFDVSHMGQIELRPRSGRMDDLALALERVVPADVLGLPEGRQRYTVLCNGRGGIIDDLMIARCGDRFVLIVNAGRKAEDVAHLQSMISDAGTVELRDDCALIAVQGPAAASTLDEIAPGVSSMRFMDVRAVSILDAACVVSRSGYTGEDGFEISVPARDVERLVRRLIANPAVAMVGLGARDSLRLEAGLCLYGADIDETTTPVEAALEWTIPGVRRRGGKRAGGFRGSDAILGELDTGATRRRVGLRPRDRTPVRSGATLCPDANGLGEIGAVTSGGFGPTLNAPVAMGYVSRELSGAGSTVFGVVRGRAVAMDVVTLPFIPHRYQNKP